MIDGDILVYMKMHIHNCIHIYKNYIDVCKICVCTCLNIGDCFLILSLELLSITLTVLDFILGHCITN